MLDTSLLQFSLYHRIVLNYSQTFMLKKYI